jgi:hypothetical protein
MTCDMTWDMTCDMTWEMTWGRAIPSDPHSPAALTAVRRWDAVVGGGRMGA